MRPSRERDGDVGEHGDRGNPGAGSWLGVARRCLTGQSSRRERVREPEEAEREQQRGGSRGPRPSGLEAAGDDQHLAREERRGWQAGERAERDPHRRAKGWLCPGDPGRRVAAGRGSCPSSGVAA